MNGLNDGYSSGELSQDESFHLHGANNNPSTGRTSDRELVRMARRAEEAAALNHAILMSLQAPPSRVDADGNVQPPTQQHVDSLMAMGFTQEQSEQALRENGDNVDLAANHLLGSDF